MTRLFTTTLLLLTVLYATAQDLDSLSSTSASTPDTSGVGIETAFLILMDAEEQCRKVNEQKDVQIDALYSVVGMMMKARGLNLQNRDDFGEYVSNWKEIDEAQTSKLNKETKRKKIWRTLLVSETGVIAVAITTAVIISKIK